MKTPESSNSTESQYISPELQVNVDLTSAVNPALAMLPGLERINTQVAVQRALDLLSKTQGVEGVSPLMGVHIQPGVMFNVQEAQTAVWGANNKLHSKEEFAITATDKPYVHTLATTKARISKQIEDITASFSAGNMAMTEAVKKAITAMVMEFGWARVNTPNFQQMIFNTLTLLENTKSIDGQVLFRLCSQELTEPQTLNHIDHIIKQYKGEAPLKILIEPNANYHGNYADFVNFVKQQRDFWLSNGVLVGASIDVTHLEEIRQRSDADMRVAQFLEDLLGSKDANLVGLMEVSNVVTQGGITNTHTLPFEGDVDFKAVFTSWGRAYQFGLIPNNTTPMIVYETKPTDYNRFLGMIAGNTDTLAKSFTNNNL